MDKLAFLPLALMVALALPLFEWIAGRLLYSMGMRMAGLSLMAQSGVFVSHLPGYCQRLHKPCDGACRLWTCPLYSEGQNHKFRHGAQRRD